MIPSVKDIFKINTIADLSACLDQFDTELTEKLSPLFSQLQQNILSNDVVSIETHMAYIESWRIRIVKYLMLASAFVEHAKDSTFLADKFKEADGKSVRVSENERDAYRRKSAGGFVALQLLLEGTIDSIDSRVNLCKKVLGVEIDGKSGQRYS